MAKVSGADFFKLAPEIVERDDPPTHVCLDCFAPAQFGVGHLPGQTGVWYCYDCLPPEERQTWTMKNGAHDDDDDSIPEFPHDTTAPGGRSA